MNRISILIGEPGARCTKIAIDTNCPPDQFDRYYERGKQLIGFDLKGRCYDSDDTPWLPDNEINLLGGWNYPHIDSITGNNQYLTVDTYLLTYMFFIKMGYNDINIDSDAFVWSRVDFDLPTVNAGGLSVMYN